MARTIESAGVEIRERDISLVASLPVGTNIYINGFAPQGPTDELVNVTSISEFEAIYGTPTNAAERFFYHSCAQVLESPGNLLVTRLPYGSGSGGGVGTQYSALLFPVETTYNAAVTSGTTLIQNATAYTLGEPTQFILTDAQYAQWESGQINWATTTGAAKAGTPSIASALDISSISDVGKAGLVIINELKTVVDDKYEGFYVAVTDNANIGDTSYDAVTSIQFKDPNTDAWAIVPETRLEFDLTGTDINDSISEDVETIPSWDFESSLYNDSLIVSLFKIRPTQYGQLQNVSLTKVLTESHVGSLDSQRKWTPDFGEESFFLGTRINSDSTYMKVIVNPYIASKGGTWIGDDGLPEKLVRVKPSVDSAFAMGPFTDPVVSTNRQIGNVPQKLERSLRLAENVEQVPIDIVCDAGLSTVWSAASGNLVYDDTTYISMTALENATTGSSSHLHNDWATIYNQINVFAAETRRDCLAIADPIRNIFVQGEDYKTINNPDKNFSSNILTPLKNLVGGSSSNYACTYANWVKKYDNKAGKNVWLPFSGFAAKIMAQVDANLYPWWAPAGLNNGLITNIVDLAIKPTQKQRDLLYRNSLNPVVHFPGDGYAIWGQKTLQKKPSAFDRINVRRLFLTLEKATLNVMRYFVFEPNTNFTRTRVVNTLTPIFDTARNNEGVYDYLIVCDERNNTAQVIDNNELVVDIYIKPVRAAEFILVNFIATRTDQDFNELI